ncbi:MAG: hypothetical protein H6536_07295 [Bacteroidales bacterium]|nr:hypothetical protein [Bacteroidales bacterium]
MYRIEKKTSGYVIIFSGVVNAQEMKQWYDESKLKLANESANSFGVIIDMKNLKPLEPEASAIMKSGQKLYRDKGMLRSAVILSNSELCGQFKAIASMSGILNTERYIDASASQDPIAKAIKWVREGVE